MSRGYEFSEESGMPQILVIAPTQAANGLAEMSARPVPPSVMNPNFGRVVPVAVIIERVMRDVSTRSSFIDSLNQQREGEA